MDERIVLVRLHQVTESPAWPAEMAAAISCSAEDRRWIDVAIRPRVQDLRSRCWRGCRPPINRYKFCDDSDIGGAFPGQLALTNPPKDGKTCGVSLSGYLQRLNGARQGAGLQGQTLCRAGFLAAQGLNPATRQSYLNQCTTQRCP